MSSSTTGVTKPHNQRRRAVIASTVGTSIEWYDFFLYGTAAALIFPKLFFPNSSEFAGVLESFGTQFVGFAARPIGAAIFGHYGDRIGRKKTLIGSLMLMGIGTFLIGVLPSYATLGPAVAVVGVGINIAMPRALAVPVTALLARSGGGYCVEVAGPGGINPVLAATGSTITTATSSSRTGTTL